MHWCGPITCRTYISDYIHSSCVLFCYYAYHSFFHATVPFSHICTPFVHSVQSQTHTYTRGLHTPSHAEYTLERTRVAHIQLWPLLAPLGQALRTLHAYTFACIHARDAFTLMMHTPFINVHADTVWSVYQWCTHTFKKQRISYSSTENIYIYYTWQEM